MKFKLIIYLFITGLCANTVNAQVAIRALKIGDKVPDIQLSVINYKSPVVNLSDFRGRLLILDFWSTFCSVCIAQFPKLVSLQERFGKKLMILPVGFDYHESGSIENFISNVNGTERKFKLPSAIQSKRDSIMIKLFPFEGLPQEVWIDKNGKLLAITDQFSISEENIQKVLENKKVFLPEKYTDPNFKIEQPLLVNGNGGDETDFSYRSIITKYNPVLKQEYYNNTDSLRSKLTMINETAINLIKVAFANSYCKGELINDIGYDPFDKRVIIEGKNSHHFKNWQDTRKYTGIEMDRFKKDYLYCYEVILPSSFSSKDTYKDMFNDLQRFFKVKVSLQKREIKCLVLRRARKYIIQNNKSTHALLKEGSSLSEKLEIHDIKYLISYLNNTFEIPYIVNGLQYKTNSNINIELSKVTNLHDLQFELKQNYLRLSPSVKKIEMLVISCY